MDRRNLLQALCALGLSSLSARVLAGGKMAVIVNAQNGLGSLGAAEIETIFTTRKLYWPDGARIVPFNFPPLHPLRVAFDRAALHLSPEEVARFWIDRRVRGGQPPPKAVPDAETMLRIVAKLPAAVGYLPLGAMPAAAKVVAEL